LSDQKCIVCGSVEKADFYPAIVKCQDCGFISADVRLTDEEMFELYKKDYFFGQEYSDYIADKKVLQRNFNARMKVLGKMLDPVRHRRLLEVGCAYGFFLETVRDLFDEITGIDIAEDGIRHASEELGLNVVQSDLRSHDFDGGKFDVVCMWDTVEHLRDPDLYLQKIAEITEPGALLALTTGDIGSFNARLRKEKWRLLHPPTHIHYFSQQSMRRFLVKYDFEVLYSGHCGFYRSTDNVAYWLLARNRNLRWMYDLLRRTGITKLSFYLNLLDIMYVIARKR